MSSMMTTPLPGPPPSGYRPGTCNIGTAEVAARRRVGHVGAAVTLVVLAVLVVTRVPAPWRLVLLLPAAVSASGYLQARLHFCANFGLRGVFNFSGRLRATESVVEAKARARDRRQALRIIGLAALVGGAVALAAVLLPV